MARHLTAVNTAPDSENRMHGDEARAYGFSGGLVPGVDVLAYAVDVALDRWGTEWFRRGRLSGRLKKPVYDGEAIDVPSTTEGDCEIASVVGPGEQVVVGVGGQEGECRAEVELSMVDDARRAELLSATHLDAYPVAAMPAPDERPAAAAELLEPGTVLATQRAGFHADKATSYLREISEEHPAFRDERIAHPGWLLRFSNWALSSTVVLGPWIHVSSDLTLFEPVRDGDVLDVRARVTDRDERRGHQFVDLAVAYFVNGTPVAHCDHSAIWQPRRNG